MLSQNMVLSGGETGITGSVAANGKLLLCCHISYVLGPPLQGACCRAGGQEIRGFLCEERYWLSVLDKSMSILEQGFTD